MSNSTFGERRERLGWITSVMETFTRTKSVVLHLYGRAFLKGVKHTNIAGSIFDRFADLTQLLDECADKTVLDIGASEGLVTYEFAKKGASVLHGLERDKERVWIAQRIFRDVSSTSGFWSVDLCEGVNAIESGVGEHLLSEYDIVLFLGVYHHIKDRMSVENLDELIDWLAAKTGTHLAVRSNHAAELVDMFKMRGLELVHSPDIAGSKGIGKLYLYRRHGS